MLATKNRTCNEDLWFKHLDELESFIKKHKRMPSAKGKHAERKLRSWIGTQKNAKEKVLSEEQIKALEKVPLFKWAISYEERWVGTYNKVRDFYKLHGVYPSVSSMDYEEKKLGLWCANQKRPDRREKLDSYQLKLIKKLRNWDWGSSIDAKWEARLKEVIAFCKKHKSMPSAYADDLEEKRLGVWCSSQRYAKKKNKLSAKQIKAIEKISYWEWQSQHFNRRWMTRYKEFRDFVSEHRRHPSLFSEDKKEKSLSAWKNHQRQAERNVGGCKMTKERYKLLQKIPGWTWIK